MFKLIFIFYFVGTSQTLEIPIDYNFKTESGCYISGKIAFEELKLDAEKILSRIEKEIGDDYKIDRVVYKCRK